MIDPNFTVVATSTDRDRFLAVDTSSRYRPSPDDPGHLIKAAIGIVSSGEWLEQTIWEPNLEARRPATLERRLTHLPEERLSPQRVTNP